MMILLFQITLEAEILYFAVIFIGNLLFQIFVLILLLNFHRLVTLEIMMNFYLVLLEFVFHYIIICFQTYLLISCWLEIKYILLISLIKNLLLEKNKIIVNYLEILIIIELMNHQILQKQTKMIWKKK